MPHGGPSQIALGRNAGRVERSLVGACLKDIGQGKVDRQALVEHAIKLDLGLHEDDRGWLSKLLIESDIPDGSRFGEIYVVRALPGRDRGGHYHKLTSEWFFVLGGQVKLTLRDALECEKTFEMRGNPPEGVFVPAGVWHKFDNLGEGDALILARADREYDPDHIDTYSELPT